jgi:hypothetical protein
MRLKSPWRTLARLAGLALVAGAVSAAPAAALPEGYHYEMVSPPDKNDGDVGAGGFVGQFFAAPDGDHFAYNALGGFGNAGSNGISGAYAATRGDEFWSSTSLLLNMAPSALLGTTVAPAISNDFSTALSMTTLNQETGEEAPGFGGFTYLMDVATRDIELFSVADQTGNETWGFSNDQYGANEDFSRIVFTAGADLVDDGLTPPTGNRVFLRTADGSHTLVSVLPNGDPSLGAVAPSHRRPVSADANIVYFNGTSTGSLGLYRRDIDAGETSRVNADENSGEDPPLAAATFVGASADGEIAYFISNQKLVDEDTDNINDLYRYDHSKPAGSRLTLISVDDEPGDTEGQVRAAHGVSADGETVLFTADGQLVPGEPTDGTRLYVYTDGELRYVSPSTMTSSSADRNYKLAENGETFVFLSNAAGITPDDNGGLPQAYVYDVADDELACASCRPGETSESPAELMRFVNLGNNLVTSDAPRRVASDQGHVFFMTAERLVNEDTNGLTDVYVWQDGEVELISTGRSTDHSWFLDASVDGSSVFFMTREQLSGWDWDNRIDAYAARTGDALPEPPAPVPPCTGEDCQGPPPLPPAFGEPNTAEYDGPGNPQADPVDCTPAERKANRLANKAQQLNKKAKRLKKQARKASGKKAKRLGKRAKKAQRQAKAKRKQARQARNQLALCREEAEL